MSKYCFDWTCGMEVPHQHQAASILITGATSTPDESESLRAELSAYRDQIATLEARVRGLEMLLGHVAKSTTPCPYPEEKREMYGCTCARCSVRRALNATTPTSAPATPVAKEERRQSALARLRELPKFPADVPMVHPTPESDEPCEDCDGEVPCLNPIHATPESEDEK